MTTNEFKTAVGEFHEHLYQKVPEEVGVMEIWDSPNGLTILLKASKKDEGLSLVWERRVSVPSAKLAEGLGALVEGLLALTAYPQTLSIEEGHGFPFEHSNFEVEDRWYLDFGAGVKIFATRHRINESRTSRVLHHLKTPWPEWRVAPAYPDNIRGTFGWDARWAEAHAERAARASYKMMASSWARLNVKCGRGAVQLRGQPFEATQDHDSQDWPQHEL